MQNLPLAGVRILDMATVLAAPFSATLCADMGADVVKLELPDGNDTLRTLAPVHEEHAIFWKTANRGKKGISLDVRQAEGCKLFLELIQGFDVLVENFRTGTLDRWGLDIATLHRHNPRLIVLRVTGYGQTGPLARKPGFARIFEAMSGFAHLIGETDGPPQHMNYPLGDVMTGVFGAFAITTALIGRNSKPVEEQRGTEIDLSATEAMLRLLDALPAEYALSGIPRNRAGSRATYTAPSNVYKTSDGIWVTVVSSGNAIFKRLTSAMQMPELATDPRFSNNLQRMANLEVLDGIITDWCGAQTLQQLAERLDSMDVPYTKVYSIADVMEDAHLQERQAIIELQDPVLGPLPAPAPVPRFAGQKTPTPTVGPSTGQHNSEIFGKLGLTDGEMQSLKSRGVI
ncbi:CoA transferase [Candidimonas nitroreducens]|uniref:CoA transferase n=2 Tax=Candidimonas nitroreducens TaxID=683354 RepID=A0A225MIP4_9BURK|nr:CaiB/BaiF CoA-transferase family protein [Candidimonas nitroreducens]OWT60183.1 CoA transferase [Candidimonas nitroreducens]